MDHGVCDVTVYQSGDNLTDRLLLEKFPKQRSVNPHIATTRSQYSNRIASNLSYYKTRRAVTNIQVDKQSLDVSVNCREINQYGRCTYNFQ